MTLNCFKLHRFFAAVILLHCLCAQSQPYGLTQRPAVAPFLNGNVPQAGPGISGNWSAVVAFTNLVFTNALGILPVPGTSKLVVWEREGRMYSFTNSPSAAQKTLVLDIHNQCQGWDDSGLLGVAFHPGFSSNHFMFVYYTWVAPGTVAGDPNNRPPTFVNGAYHDRLERYTLDTNGVVIPGSVTLFIDQIANSVWHNGGGIFFHSQNGFLYYTDGDDENGPTQVINQNLLSGVFRIDVDKRGGAISHAPPRQPLIGTTTNYYVPNDNPFVGQTNVLEEFWALGLRSPHRMTIDPPTGRIFIADVGAGAREEIDIIEANDPFGLNFQWSAIEGLQGDLTPPYIGVNRRPVLDYNHGEGQAIIGGYVYRGAEFAADLGGKYIFGDSVQRTIWALDESKSPAEKVFLCVMPPGPGPESGSGYTGLASFGLDANNELYLCQMSSTAAHIYKLQRSGASSPPPQPFPALLSQTGAFANTTNLTPATSLIPYDVNSPLWSDGAAKQRWLVIPTNSQITFAANGEWTFPGGSVFVKHFELPVNDTNAAIRRRLETRFLVRDTNGAVFGATYKWRANNSDADLLADALDEAITIQTAAGTRTQTWHYPSRSECLACHTVAAKGVLGLKTRQSNRDFLYPDSGVTDNQLRAWNHIGLLSPALNEANIPAYDKLVNVTNSTASLELRARSYLDANCSQCHRPGGVNAFWDARSETPLATAGIINGPVGSSLGISGGKVVVPQNLAKSILYQRANSTAAIKMPPLAKNVIDPNGVSALAGWINSLTPTTNSLPPPWLNTDLGAALSGDASYTNGHFSVIGSGDDIWGNADGGHFVYRDFTGDGQITARVLAQQNTDGWAKSGVMFRETLDAGSRHAFMAVTPGNGAAFQRRTVTDGGSDSNDGPALVAPYWVRLVRAGDNFTGYISPDGTNWTSDGSVTIAMNSSLEIGLAVTAHNNGLLNLSVFDNVSVLAAGVRPPLVLTSSATPSVAGAAPQAIQFNAQASGGKGSGATFDTTDDHNGIITAQGENAAGSETAVVAFDNSTATKWLDFADINPATRASWIQYQYSNGLRFAVSQYTVTSANDAPERDPRDWRLLGSTNGGTTWTMLDTHAGETFANRFQTRTFTPTNSGAFNLFRLQIDSVATPASANSVQLAELEFIGLAGYIYAWSFGDGATSTAQNPLHTYASNGTYNVVATASDGAAAVTNLLTVIVGTPPITTVKVNFQTASAPSVPAGYVADYGYAYGDRSNGFFYGWDIDNTANARYRNSTNSPDLRYDTLNHMQKSGGATTWEFALPSGQYQVHLVAGDPDNYDGTYRLTVEGALFLDAQPTDGARFFQRTKTVTVSDGRFTLGNDVSAQNNKICFLEITAVPPGSAPAWVASSGTVSNGVLSLTLQGVANVSYVIQGTTNFTDWTPEFTNTAVGGLLQFTTPFSGNASFHFYRAAQE